MGKAITKIAEGFGAKMMALKMHKPIPTVDFTYIGQIVLILLGLYLISAAFSYLQQYIMAGVAQKTVYNSKEVDEKLSLLPLKFFDARTHGEILSRINGQQLFELSVKVLTTLKIFLVIYGKFILPQIRN